MRVPHHDQCRDEARCVTARARRRQTPAKRRGTLPSSGGRPEPSAQRPAMGREEAAERTLPKVRRRPAAAAPVPAPWPAPEPKSCKKGAIADDLGKPQRPDGQRRRFRIRRMRRRSAGGGCRSTSAQNYSRIPTFHRPWRRHPAGRRSRRLPYPAAGLCFGASPPQRAAPGAWFQRGRFGTADAVCGRNWTATRRGMIA